MSAQEALLSLYERRYINPKSKNQNEKCIVAKMKQQFKSEYRMSKYETNPKSEIKKTKEMNYFVYNFRISDFLCLFRISDFEFRI